MCTFHRAPCYLNGPPAPDITTRELAVILIAFASIGRELAREVGEPAFARCALKEKKNKQIKQKLPRNFDKVTSVIAVMNTHRGERVARCAVEKKTKTPDGPR